MLTNVIYKTRTVAICRLPLKYVQYFLFSNFCCGGFRSGKSLEISGIMHQPKTTQFISHLNSFLPFRQHLSLTSALQKLYFKKWIAMANLPIVEERLYSFFFAFFPQKNEVSFFRFFSSTQLLMKTFVLLRSWIFFQRFTSFCFVFTNFWNIPIRFTIDFEKNWANSLRFTLLFQNFGTTWLFSLRSSEVQEQAIVSFSILVYFGLDSFLLRFWQVVG